MKQIDIKKPKYIIPILILPFILGIGWLVKDMIQTYQNQKNSEHKFADDVNCIDRHKHETYTKDNVDQRSHNLPF